MFRTKLVPGLFLATASKSFLPTSHAYFLDLTLTGTTLTLNEIPYYVPPHAIGSIRGNLSNVVECSGLAPITILNTESHSFDLNTFDALTEHFKEIDDVFQDGFLQGKVSFSSSSHR